MKTSNFLVMRPFKENPSIEVSPLVREVGAAVGRLSCGHTFASRPRGLTYGSAGLWQLGTTPSGGPGPPLSLSLLVGPQERLHANRATCVQGDCHVPGASVCGGRKPLSLIGAPPDGTVQAPRQGLSSSRTLPAVGSPRLSPQFGSARSAGIGWP